MQDHLRNTRRNFLSRAAAALVWAARPRRALSQEHQDGTPASLAADPMRPQFHLLPSKNWMNDPNGPIFYKGRYHMFFQYNPLAAVWGNMSWNHAISTDMLHWSLLPLALTPTPNSPDAYGIFSGSALAVGDRVYAFYTGTRKSGPDLATIKQDGVQESQCLAYSDDPRLVRWTKLPAPVIPLPPAGLKVTGFRDPSVWPQGEWYYMTVGSGEAHVGGCVLLYRSRDLNAWEYLHKLTGGTWTGKDAANPCDNGEMWECPDFFPLDGQHVLIYSTLGKVYWQSGVLDEAAMTFAAKQSGELDLDSFYAPKTQLDAQGRRILWGWIQERRPDAAMLQAGWSGMMSLPRVLSLDPDGTLRLQVLPAAARLRTRSLPAQESRSGIIKTLPAACGEVLCTGTAGQDFRFSMEARGVELLQVSYSAASHAFTVNGHTIALRAGDMPTLHAFVDASVIELILGERIGYTKRFYYVGKAPDVLLAAKGPGSPRLDAWILAPTSSNRMTTPAGT